jgi:glycerol-3-phosphate dehydrogenase
MDFPPTCTADLLIAGGGITGAGIARDAAMRGLSVMLVEQADFASGTSSRSSRLLHGGLRYLAQGHIGLVREASHEKIRLCRIAPHLCEPLRFLFPVWKGDPHPLWQMAIGVRLYDLLCGGQNLGKSATHKRTDAIAMAPGLRAEGLAGAVSYFDGFTNDARLVIDTLRSAASAGVTLRNYSRLVSAEAQGELWNCTVRNERDGSHTIVRARAVANATGAWAQKLPPSSVRLRLTKGVHLVIDRARLPVESAVVLSEGQRILFVLPWGERVILGTTDTDYSGDPGLVRTDSADVRYILNVVNRGFPGARLDSQDLIATWAGVRPLIAPRREQAGAPSDVSRRHEIRMARPGWFDVAGGKLTTYRLMAEQTVDRAGAYLGAKLQHATTADTPLLDPGATRFSGVLPPPVTREVVQHACRNEWAKHLDDVVLRRTGWYFYHGPGIAEGVSRWMAEECGWSEAERVAELDRLRLLNEIRA